MRTNWKKTMQISILMLTVFFTSCSTEELEETNELNVLETTEKSAAVNRLDDNLTNRIVHIYPERGLSSNRKFLSCNTTGEVVDLWPVDDNSGRQKWVITPIGNGKYHIKPVAGLFSGRNWLSTAATGEVVDLWYNDDNSGRQQWSFSLINPLNSTYQIYITRGLNSPRFMLSCTSDGSKVDLWNVDDYSGRQRWVIEPAN